MDCTRRLHQIKGTYQFPEKISIESKLNGGKLAIHICDPIYIVLYERNTEKVSGYKMGLMHMRENYQYFSVMLKANMCICELIIFQDRCA
jgi:hypothetical protein